MVYHLNYGNELFWAKGFIFHSGFFTTTTASKISATATLRFVCALTNKCIKKLLWKVLFEWWWQHDGLREQCLEDVVNLIEVLTIRQRMEIFIFTIINYLSKSIYVCLKCSSMFVYVLGLFSYKLTIIETSHNYKISNQPHLLYKNLSCLKGVFAKLTLWVPQSYNFDSLLNTKIVSK